MLRRSVLVLIGSFLCAMPITAQMDYEPVFEEDACPFPVPAGDIEGQTINCGYLIVPEDRSAPEGNAVELAVAIFESTGSPAPEPIVYLEGGPGGSALTAADAWVESPFRADYTIILIDQRGTGYSSPTLDCYEINEDVEDPEAACYQRLVDEGINLSAYNSAENAADIDDLRLALGYDQVNLYGVSYGTRLALTIMRDYPEGVRSVILDSVYPPEINAYEESLQNTLSAFDALFDACAADADCTAAYGDLRGLFYAAVDQYNSEPLLYEDENGDEVEVYGDDLISTLTQTLYVTTAIPTLPYGMYLLSAGDSFGYDLLQGFFTLDELTILEQGGELPESDEPEMDENTPDGDSEGMFNSVECREEIPFNDFDTTVAAAETAPAAMLAYFEQDAAAMFDTCAMWQVDSADPVETQPVVSDIPTLVLAGDFDPATPPTWSQSAANYLSRGYYYQFPDGGHGVAEINPCSLSITTAFLSDPNTAPDGSCIASITPQFYVP